MPHLDNPRPTLRLPSKAAQVAPTERKAELIPMNGARRNFIPFANEVLDELGLEL